MIRHFCWARKFELVTGLSENELLPYGVFKAMAGGTSRAGTSQSSTKGAPPTQSSSKYGPSTSRQTPTTSNRVGCQSQGFRIRWFRLREKQLKVRKGFTLAFISFDHFFQVK